LLPECGDKGLAALRAFEFAAGINTEFGEIPGAETRQLMMLPVAPEIFNRVQLRGLRRQELQLDGTSLGFD
jgi:hypothetical protein